MRIAHKRGEKSIKKSKSLKQRVEDLKTILIIEHNRKFERERLKQSQRASTN